MKYNSETKFVEADENKVISLDNQIFVKCMYLAKDVNVESVIEINESDIPIIQESNE